MDAVDFDPLTEEGREDLNNIADEEFNSLIPQENETEKSWNQRLSSRFIPALIYLKQETQGKQFQNTWSCKIWTKVK